MDRRMHDMWHITEHINNWHITHLTPLLIDGTLKSPAPREMGMSHLPSIEVLASIHLPSPSTFIVSFFNLLFTFAF
jgi:hypothetical protein